MSGHDDIAMVRCDHGGGLGWSHPAPGVPPWPHACCGRPDHCESAATNLSPASDLAYVDHSTPPAAELPGLGPDDWSALRDRVRERQARTRLSHIEALEDVALLAIHGTPRRSIAEIADLAESEVRQLLREAERNGMLGGAAFEETPEMIVLRTVVRHGDRRQMVDRLVEHRYKFGASDLPPAEGGAPGTWSQVCDALLRRWLSDAEARQISLAVQQVSKSASNVDRARDHPQ